MLLEALRALDTQKRHQQKSQDGRAHSELHVLFDHTESFSLGPENAPRTPQASSRARLGLPYSVSHVARGSSSLFVVAGGRLFRRSLANTADPFVPYLHPPLGPAGWALVKLSDAVLALDGGSRALTLEAGEGVCGLTQSERTLAVPEPPGPATLAAVSDDGGLAAVAGTPNGWVRILDLDSGSMIAEHVDGLPIRSLLWAGDSAGFVLVDASGSVRSLALDGALGAPLPLPEAALADSGGYDLVWIATEDGVMYVARLVDGVVRTWRAPDVQPDKNVQKRRVVMLRSVDAGQVQVGYDELFTAPGGQGRSLVLARTRSTHAGLMSEEWTRLRITSTRGFHASTFVGDPTDSLVAGAGALWTSSALRDDAGARAKVGYGRTSSAWSGDFAVLSVDGGRLLVTR